MQAKGEDDILDQDLAVARDASCADADRGRQPKAERAAKTPQELAEIRKAMMKKRHQPAVRDKSADKSPQLKLN